MLGYLRAKLAVQTFQGNPAATDTMLELQLEQADGGMPGNTTIREVGEEFTEIITRHKNDAHRILSQGTIAPGNWEDYVPNDVLRRSIQPSSEGSIHAITLNESLTISRYWSNEKYQRGSWATIDPSLSPEEARAFLALPNGNYAFGRTEYAIPEGTTVIISKVKEQKTELWAGEYAIGGGFQIIIPDPEVLIEIP